MTTRRIAALIVCTIVVAGCSPIGTPTGPTGAVATSGAASMRPTPMDDLDRLDQFVRSNHVAPFAIHAESEWTARLAEVRSKLAGTTDPDARIVLLASMVGLLDTHSWVMRTGGFDAYPVFVYHFTEGWFVIAALDRTLIGARLVSIGGHPVADVETTLRRLTPHDNERGFLLNSQALFSNASYLHGAGIVTDPAAPAYGFEMPDGTVRTENLSALPENEWGSSLDVYHTLVGEAPEAVARGRELVWFRVDQQRRVMLIFVNDYGDESAVVRALDDAIDAGTVDRVVLDIRFLPGGTGDFRLLDVLKADRRVNQPGHLAVVIGRENYSIANAIVRDFDVNTQALLIGEPTPARADNFRCDCRELLLPDAGITVAVPTWWDRLADDRPQVDPDVLVELSAADFFAGRDPILDAAIAAIARP